MPAAALIPLVASVGAGALGASATTAGIIGAGAGLAASALTGSNGGSNAQSYLSPNTVNTAQLEQQALDIGNQNAAASRALQNEYTPWVTSGQGMANQGLQGALANQTTALAPSTAYLQNNLTAPLNSSLINQSAGVAGQQLALGGQLDQGTANAVTRQGLAVSGQSTPGGLGGANAVTARDLGLTSQQLLNQRLQNASSIGGQQLGASQANANAVLSRIGALQGLTQMPISNYMQSANMYNNIQGPQAGLSPGSIASLAVGNQNSLNAYDASMANIIGQQTKNQQSLISTAGALANSPAGSSALSGLGSGLSNLFSSGQNPYVTGTIANGISNY
jgi:hypothetical protein